MQLREQDCFREYGEKLIVFPHAIEGSSKFQGEQLPACGGVRRALMKALLFVYFPSCVLKMHSLKNVAGGSVCIDGTAGELDQGFVFIWEKRKNPGHQKCLLYQEMNSLLEGSSGYKTKIKTRALYKPTLYCLLHKQPRT